MSELDVHLHTEDVFSYHPVGLIWAFKNGTPAPIRLFSPIVFYDLQSNWYLTKFEMDRRPASKIQEFSFLTNYSPISGEYGG
ncbi:hypothetical protein Bhyg_09583 [Pseudolycoriella hygida]|uniref:Uncharacterized protein n=1 Tax=Pseudolycoriella hygida TaxID=35572 RepID=A0A9Q0N6Z5_9DIPT|nr:hypothetical protein Bhyg_09583 [Pseudolycoriella hygida]